MLLQLLISFLGSLVALFLVLLIERMKLPYLFISASDDANLDEQYTQKGRWKFWRVKVTNRPLPTSFGWLIKRQAAENCHATIAISHLGGQRALFVMRGRWSSLPELPHLGPQQYVLKALHPDPITIPADGMETLDILGKKSGDTQAWGWNNEAYLNDWETPAYKLVKGNYDVTVTVRPQNGVPFTKKLRLIVSDSIEDTNLQTT